MKTLDRLERGFFYLILLFLPTQLGKHFWPPFAYVSGIRVDYLSPTIYFTDILLLLLFIFFIYRVLWKNRNSKNQTVKIKEQIKNKKILIVLVVTFLAVNVFQSQKPMLGWYSLLKLFECLFFGLYTAYVLKKQHYARLLIVFFVGIFLESLLAIAQFVQQGSLGGILYVLGERTFTAQTPGIANASLDGNLVLRPYATFSHPNVLAGYLTIAMAIVIFSRRAGSYFAGKFFNSRKIIYIAVLIIGTIALLLTMSRVAIVLWFILVMMNLPALSEAEGLLHLKVIKRVESEPSRRIFYILLSTFIVVAIVMTPLSSRFTSLLKRADEAVVQRQEISDAAMRMVQASPFVGVGLQNFLVELPKYQNHKTKTSVFWLQPVHNIYLLIAAETGIIGLTFFLWFIIKTLRQKTGRQILCLVLFLGLFDHYLFTLQQGQLLFSFVLGYCWQRSSVV